MPKRLALSTVAGLAADRWISYQDPEIDGAEKARIFQATQYNLLVKAFNASTVLLVAAVAFAILFAHTAAVTYGSIALFTRSTTDWELNKYSAPLNEPTELTKITHLLGLTAPASKVINIFGRVGGEAPRGWEEVEWWLFEHAVWRNEVPLPPRQ